MGVYIQYVSSIELEAAAVGAEMLPVTASGETLSITSAANLKLVKD